MKRWRSCVIGLMMLGLSAVPVEAAQGGGVVDYALYTDITAQINGHPVRSYNIGGYTAVVAEELRGYGFHVLWDGTQRTLNITRATRDGVPETPEVWPEYLPQKQNHPIGTRARPVYATDIVTCAAGRRVESFNLNGETLVWIEDLTPFGQVAWDGERRVIDLTLADPVELALEEMISGVESWRETGGSGSTWQTWTARNGTLLYTCYTGTPHGTSRNLTFLKHSGEQVRILELLPPYGWGPSYYFNPSQITLDEYGQTLTFLTPVMEAGESPEDEGRMWGDTLCRVDLHRGEMSSMQPLSEGLTDWSLTLRPNPQSDTGDGLSIAITRTGAEVQVTAEKYPGVNMDVVWNVNGISVVHRAAMFLEGGMEGDYGKTWQSLRQLGLPDTTMGADIQTAPELRKRVEEWVTVLHNGEMISGDVWWSRGNNHIDLNITFDQPMRLREGDTAELRLG